MLVVPMKVTIDPSAQDAKPRAPIAKENERADDHLRRREEVACAPNTEGWEQPEDYRAMAD
jgi:hypothetical protein